MKQNKKKRLLVAAATMLLSACNMGGGDNQSSPSVDAGFDYVGTVQTYRQELLSSSQRSTRTGQYETQWVFYEDDICPIYEKNGQNYVKWNGMMCEVINLSPSMFPEETSQGFTRSIDTKGEGRIVLE